MSNSPQTTSSAFSRAQTSPYQSPYKESQVEGWRSVAPPLVLLLLHTHGNLVPSLTLVYFFLATKQKITLSSCNAQFPDDLDGFFP